MSACTVRFLAATAYVLLHILRSSLGSRLLPARLARIQERGRPGRSFVGPLLSAAIVITVFVQYFVLTGSFPVFLVCFLAIGSIILRGAIYIVGAVLGLDNPEKSRKITSLGFIWGFARGKSIGPIIIVFGIVFLLWPIAVLWVYFTYFENHIEKVIQISIFHFCIPAIASLVLVCVANWTLIGSRHVDDDVRNANFLSLLATSVNVTIIVLYPAYLIGSGGTLTLTSPGIWLLLSTPTLILVLGGLLPYLAGTFRYKTELANQIQWRREWISEMLGVLKSPSAELTESERVKLIRSLDQEIRDKFNENTLFRTLQDDLTVWLERSQGQEQRAQIIDQQVRVNGATGESLTGTAVAVRDGDRNEDRGSIRDNLRKAKTAISGTYSLLPTAEANSWEQARAFIHREREKLIEWDTSFSNIYELLNLRQSTVDFDQKGLLEHLTEKAKNLLQKEKDMSGEKKKNILSSILIAVFTLGASSFGTWAFKTYEPRIIELIGTIIRWD